MDFPFQGMSFMCQKLLGRYVKRIGTFGINVAGIGKETIGIFNQGACNSKWGNLFSVSLTKKCRYQNETMNTYTPFKNKINKPVPIEILH